MGWIDPVQAVEYNLTPIAKLLLNLFLGLLNVSVTANSMQLPQDVVLDIFRHVIRKVVANYNLLDSFLLLLNFRSHHQWWICATEPRRRIDTPFEFERKLGAQDVIQDRPPRFDKSALEEFVFCLLLGTPGQLGQILFNQYDILQFGPLQACSPIAIL
jgi:hypothetical protein